MMILVSNRTSHNVTINMPLSVYGSLAILHPIFFDLITSVFKADFLALLFGGMLFSALCFHCLFLFFPILRIRLPLSKKQKAYTFLDGFF